jgi:hypothetical protein
MGEAARHVLRAEVVKVDRETLKHVRYPIFLPAGSSEERVLRSAMRACNVGDFLILNGKTYRRVRGGFRKATDEDMAELIGSQIVGDDGSGEIHAYFPEPKRIVCRCTLKGTFRERRIRQLLDGDGNVVSERVEGESVYGTEMSCERWVRLTRSMREEGGIESAVEGVMRRMFEDCLQRECFDPVIIHSPRVPMHIHGPPWVAHPLLKRHDGDGK